MPFDIAKARAAKKSDTQIADYLGKTYGFDVAKARASGKTDTQIAEYLSKNDKPGTKPVTPVEPQESPEAKAQATADTNSAMLGLTDRLSGVEKPAESLDVAGLQDPFARVTNPNLPDPNAVDAQNKQVLKTKGFSAASADARKAMPERKETLAKQFDAEWNKQMSSAKNGEGIKERTKSDVWTDAAKQFTGGLVSTAAGISWLADKVPGIDSEDLTAHLSGFSDYLGEIQSDQARAEAKSLENAKTAGETFETLISNPLLISKVVLESMPIVIPGMGLAAVSAKAAFSLGVKKALAKGATKEAAILAGRAAAVTAASVAGKGSEAMLSGGMSGNDTQRAVMKMPEWKLEAVSERYRELTLTMTPLEARKQLAGEVSVATAIASGTATAVGGAFAAKLNKMAGLGDTYAAQLIRNAQASKVVKEFGGETTEEVSQSFLEQIAGNVTNVDDTTGTFDEVGKSVVMGATGAIGQTAATQSLGAASRGLIPPAPTGGPTPPAGGPTPAPAAGQPPIVPPAPAPTGGPVPAPTGAGAPAPVPAATGGVPSAVELQAIADAETANSRQSAGLADEERAAGNTELADRYEQESGAAAARAKAALDTIQTEHTGLQGIVNRNPDISAAAEGIDAAAAAANAASIEQEAIALNAQQAAEEQKNKRIPLSNAEVRAGQLDAGNRAALGLDQLRDDEELQPVVPATATPATPATESQKAYDGTTPIADIKTATVTELRKRMGNVRGGAKASSDPDFKAKALAEYKQIAAEIDRRNAAATATPATPAAEDAPATPATEATVDENLPAAEVKPSSAGVSYPNRKLSMDIAKSDENEPNNTVALANVALANMQPGDKVPVGGGLVVKSVGNKAITFTKPDGKTVRFDIDSPRFEQLIRDVDGAISAHSVTQGRQSAEGIWEALKRDPAFSQDEQGIPQLIDKKPQAATAKPKDKAPAPQVSGAPTDVVLQNRDRSTPALVTQMNKIAANPSPIKAGFSRDFANGAPVITQDTAVIPENQMGNKSVVVTAGDRKIEIQYAVIEAADLLTSHAVDGTANEGYQTGLPGKARTIAGNGRGAGIKAGFKRGSTDAYVEGTANDESLHGVSAEVIRGMKEPILVRIMQPKDITANIGDESNQGGIADKDPLTHAKDDSRRINVADIEFGEDGHLTRSAIMQFVLGMPASESAGLIGRDGEPITTAKTRLMNAVFWSAYGSEALTELYAQATDPEARVIMNALAIAGTEMVQLGNLGEDHPLDIRRLVAEAAEAVINAKRQGITLANYIEQGDLALDANVLPILRMFNENSRSAKKIAEKLKEAATFVLVSVANSNDGGFFDAPPLPNLDDALGKIHETGRKTSVVKQKGPAPNGVNAEQATTNTGGQGNNEQAAEDGQAPIAGTDAFSLDAQTEGDIAAKEAREQQDTAKADEKKRIDATADAFSLSTGTVSTSDQMKPAVSGGGAGLFDQTRGDAKKDAKAANLIAIDAELGDALDDLADLMNQAGRPGQLNSGIDPVLMGKILGAGLKVSGILLKKGAVKFSIWAENMIAALKSKGVDESLTKQILKKVYLASKADADRDIRSQMDSEDYVLDYDVETIGSNSEEVQAPSQPAEPAATATVKWFGTRAKADEHIEKKRLSSTHEVVQVGQRFEIHEKPKQGEANGSAELGEGSQGALAGVPAREGEAAAGQRSAGGGAAQGSRADAQGNDRAGESGLQGARSLGNDTREVSVPEAGSAGRRADGSAGAEPVQGSADADESTVAVGGITAAVPATQLGADFAITDSDEVGVGGAKTKFKNNIAAIVLLKELERQGRPATRDEQSILAKYVGWGGIPQAFARDGGAVTQGWERQAAELREILTPDEYSAAAASTMNAHYTATEIVSGIWDAVQQFGFNGGAVLEPSVGTGNFFGKMPHGLRNASALVGVELDHITGGIAKLLYPAANIQSPMGFQDITIPDGHFDLAIGNPPFGSTQIHDGNNPAINRMSIHNYFFAKSVLGLKPNGVLAMVVTNRMMDAGADRARQFIADRTELLGAIRLPNDAFLKNAGTSVTTDIIFLRRLEEGEAATGESWTKVRDYSDKDGKTVPLNEYFHRNPDMMLGDFGAFGSMYREGDSALVAKPGQDTMKLMQEAIKKLPRDFMPTVQRAPTREVIAPVGDIDAIRVGSMFMQGDEIHVRMEDELGQQRSKPVVAGSAKSVERIKGMIAIRDALTTVRELQLSETSSEAAISKARAQLNMVYDAFVKANGPINQDANKRAFRDDPTWPQISALEEGFEKGVSAAAAKATGLKQEGPSAKKAAIFTKRTQAPYRAPESAASAKDALVASLSELGRVDLAYMSKLYGKDESEIAAELSGMIYQNPVRGWETADEYLSGNVKQKLAVAEEAAKADPQFDKNVSALQDVQPADIEAVDISVKLGAHWVPVTDVAAFAKHITGDKAATAGYVSLLAKWTIDAKAASASIAAQWGTDRATIEEIMTAAANQRTIQIKDKVSEDKYVVNEAATQAANEKVEALKSEWTRWLWSDDARRERLARQYNDTFNTDRQREYDGSHLTFPGKVDLIGLRPHQANAAWRIIQSASTLTDHVVGAGKTYTLIAAAMEMRRMGRANKPMFVVPNHLVGQWASDFVKLYPGANVLAASKKDFDKENRKRMFARIATGDWDAVIVAHSSFGKIGVHPDFVAKFIRDQIADIDVSITATREAEGKNSRNVKQIEKQKAALEEKLKDLFAQKKKDDSLYFDELGIDGLFLDEAHEFKNLQFSTSMSRIAGVPNSHSQKASDLFMKVQQVQQRTGGRNIVFATGTPISNSMAEMFTMQRYLDYKTMKDQGLAHFDAWARMYGEVVTDWELSPSGQYKMNSRFAKFVNMPELMQRYASFADVINREDINRQLAAVGKKLPVPNVKGGKPQNIIVERSAAQADYIGVASMDEYGNEKYPEGSLVWRAENLPKGAAAKEKGADNMLKIMSDARKAALDMRLIDPDASDNPKSKVNEAADRMVTIYHKWTDDKGAQLVFIDLSTPKSAQGAEASRIRDLIAKAEDGDSEAQEALDKLSPDELDALNAKFDVYNDLRDKLIARGIPAEEIAFIHSANTDAQKDELFGRVKSGRTRFLFGSTAKMGAGMNVQERLVALHHLDAPWRPSDLEQREGRIIRQENALYNRDPDGFEVEINRYATKQTLDSRMWQTIEAKARFIEQVRKGATGGREVEDIAGEAANAAEMKAASSGNPLILEEMELRQKLRKMNNEESEHDRQQHRVRAEIRSITNGMEASERLLVDTLADSKLVPASFAITIKGKLIEKHKEAGAAILLAAAPSIMNMSARAEEVTVGEYGDFTIKVEKTAGDKEKFLLWLETARGSYQVGTFSLDADPTGMAIRMANTVKQLPEKAAEREAKIAAQKADLPKLEAQIKPWPKAADLAATKAQHAGIIEKLKPKKADPAQAAAPAKEDDNTQSGGSDGKVDEKYPATYSNALVNGQYSVNEREASNIQSQKRAARSIQSTSNDAGRSAQPDLFGESAASAGPDAARLQSSADFAIQVESEITRTVKVSTNTILDASDAAEVFFPFRNRAQETFLVAMVDSRGRVTEVLQHSIGKTAEASVELMPILGAAAKNPSTESVWLAHNHPSGKTTPSNSDVSITKILGSRLGDIGIKLSGHVILGNSDFSELDSNGLIESTNRPYREDSAARTISISERNIVRHDAYKGVIGSPSEAKRIAQEYNEDGILLLSQQHDIIGFLAVTPEEMRFLRPNNGKGARRIAAAVEGANAAAAIIITKTKDKHAAYNIGNMLARLGTRTLDHIAADTGDSAAELGNDNWSADNLMFSSGGKEGAAAKGKNTKAAVQAIVSPITAKWKSGITAIVVQSVSDLPIGSVPGDVEGLYLGDGVAYLIADNLPNENRVLEVLAHEAIGHAAMEEMLGNDLMEELTKEIGAWIKNKYGVFVALSNEVNKRQPGLSPRVHAKEIIALMAERGMHRKGNIWNRVVGAVRAWLRSIGMPVKWLSTLSGPDLFKMLADAEKYVKNGDGPNPGARSSTNEAYASKDALFSVFGFDAEYSPEEISFMQDLGLLTQEEAETMQVVSLNKEASNESNDVLRGNPEGAGRRGNQAGIVSGGAKARQRQTRIENSPLLGRMRKISDRAATELRGEAETERTVDSPLGFFSGYVVRSEQIEPDSMYPDGHLQISIFGKEQIEAGLNDEPALLVVVAKNGELIINGPSSDGDTFKEFQRRGWADFAKDADGNKLGAWTALSNPGGKKLPPRQVIALLADTHARLRTWKQTEKARLHWVRSTGATGGMFDSFDDGRQYDGGRGGNVYFSRPAYDGVGDTYKLPPARNLVIKLFNKFDQIKRVTDAVKEQGGSVDVLSDVFGQEEAFHSRAASYIDRFRRHRLGSIIKRISKAGVKLEDVGIYLYAQHAEERNRQIATFNPGMPDGGSGMPTAEANQILADFQARPDIAKLDTFAKEFRDIIADTRNRLRTSGLESNDSVDAWEAMYNFYIPLAGKNEADNPTMAATGRGYDIRGGQKRALGRKDKARHVIEQIIIQHEAAVIRSEKNVVGKRLLKFVTDNPDNKLWAVNPTEQRRYVNADGEVDFRNAPLRTDKNVVSVRIDGKDTFIFLEDESMARAMKNMGSEDIGVVLRVLGVFSRFISKMFTAFSPAFVLMNAVRDFMTAMIHGYQVGGVGYSAKIAKNMAWAFSQMVQDAWSGDNAAVKLYEQSGGRTGMVHMIKDLQEKHEEVASQMAALNGVSISEIMDAFSVGFKEGRAALARKARYNIFTKPFDALFSLIESVNGVVENTTRLAAFQAAIETGKTVREAGSIAKNLTVNFNRKGEYAAGLGAAYIFFNASVQGSARMYEALKDRRLQAVAGGMALLSFAIAALQMDDDDDEDKDGRPDFEQVPAWQRSRNIIIMQKGGGYIKIPLPLGWNAFHMIGTELAVMTRSKNKESYAEGLGNIVMQAMGVFNPVGDFVPSVAAPFVEIMRNKSHFGSKIYPDYKDKLPNSQQFYDGTEGNVYERATSAANKTTGGNEFRGGWLDINPEKLQHIVEFFGGGALKFITDTSDTVTAMSDGGPKKEADKIPIAKAFYGKIRPEYQTTRYYDNKDKVLAVKREIDGLKDAQQPEEAAKVLAKNPWVDGLSDMMKPIDKDMKKLKADERAIRADDKLSAGERRKELEAVRVRRGNLVKDFNSQYEFELRKK